MALDIEKFFKVVNLSTSPVDGEALSAIRKAHAMLKAKNTTWEMVILGRPRKAEFTDEPSGKKNKKKSEGTDDDLIKHMFSVVMASVKGRSSEDFIDSIHTFYKTVGFLSAKQRSALERYYERC
jgi:hypothetical protein